MAFVRIGIVAKVTKLTAGFRNTAQLVDEANTCQERRIQNE